MASRVARWPRRELSEATADYLLCLRLFVPEVGHRSLDWPLVACVVNRLSRPQSLFCASELAVPETGRWWLVHLRLERVANRLRQEQSHFCSW